MAGMTEPSYSDTGGEADASSSADRVKTGSPDDMELDGTAEVNQDNAFGDSLTTQSLSAAVVF